MKFGSIVVAFAAVAIVAAPAHAQCWNADQIAAAKVRDMETMLMVSSLRCRADHRQMIGQYNAFVVKSRAALNQVNDTLKAHFTEEVGARRSLDAYDSYVTRIANRYGAGADGLSCDDLSDITVAALNENATFAALSDLADRADVRPVIEGGACPVTIAAR